MSGASEPVNAEVAVGGEAAAPERAVPDGPGAQQWGSLTVSELSWEVVGVVLVRRGVHHPEQERGQQRHPGRQPMLRAPHVDRQHPGHRAAPSLALPAAVPAAAAARGGLPSPGPDGPGSPAGWLTFPSVTAAAEVTAGAFVTGARGFRLRPRKSRPAGNRPRNTSRDLCP